MGKSVAGVQLWSIQSREILHALRAGQVCNLDPCAASIVRNYGLVGLPAFVWMWHEVLRTGLATSLSGLYWAWQSPSHIVEGVSPEMQLLPRANQCLLKLDVPTDKVLLSRFSLWEIALTGAAIVPQALETQGLDCTEMPLDQIMSTWHHIFDLRVNVPFSLPPETDAVQATLAEIRPEWVVS